MLSNILNTIGSKLYLAIISLCFLLLNANYLGAEGLGAVGLIVLGISIILLASDVVTGGGLTYFSSRFSTFSLVTISYGWIILVALLFVPLIYLTPIFLEAYAWHILALGIIQSALNANLNLLLGKEKVKLFNLLAVVQLSVQFASVLFFYLLINERTVTSFIYSIYLGSATAFTISFLALWPHLNEKKSKHNLRQTFNQTLVYGAYIQLANVFQLFNYRFSYFLLNQYSGIASVGIFTAGVRLSEGILLPTKSLGMVQYAKIANEKNEKESIYLTLSFFKLAIFLTVPLLAILLLIPADWFSTLLGRDFENVQTIIAAMAVGICALSMEGILSRYFSGTGRQKTNTINGFLGFISTAVLGFILIPKFGAIGAAYTSSISYFIMLVYLVVQFMKVGKVSFLQFLPSKNDVALIKAEIEKLRTASSSNQK